ncbi:MAG TPA: hypothetical protein VD994_07510 [Prosthecobacter sp.]|nr:hypothetical protein [Prosthecobacter sp.]
MIRPYNRRERKFLRFLQSLTAHPLFWVAVVILLLGQKPIGAMLPFFALLDSGTQFLDSDGDIVLNSDGAYYMASGTSDACQCACCPACANCSDGTPEAYIVTLSGVGLCFGGACTTCSGGVTSTRTTGSADGTFTVYCSSTTCVWGPTSVDSGVSASTYTGAACNTLTSTAGPSATITVTKTATPRFTINYPLLGGTASSVFEGSSSIVATCQAAGGYTINNNLTSCGTCGIGGVNGTADLDVPA